MNSGIDTVEETRPIENLSPLKATLYPTPLHNIYHLNDLILEDTLPSFIASIAMSCGSWNSTSSANFLFP